MNFYKITFVDHTINDPILIEFVEDDINTFDIIFQSKFSEESKYHSDKIPEEQIKAQVLVVFIGKNENFQRIDKCLQSINTNMNKIEEVLVYKNDNLICDLTNIVDFSSISTLMDNGNISGLKLSIIEGV